MVTRLARTLLVAVVVSAVLTGTARASRLTWSETGQLSDQHTEALACPSSTSCTALVYRGEETTEYTFSPTDPARRTSDAVDPTDQPGQLACPSTSLCVFGDAAGNVITFDPADPGDQDSWQASDAEIDALACPSASQCVLSDTQGGEQTFDPATLGSSLATGRVDAGGDWLSCPSTTQCTLVGADGVQTFDPLSPPQTSQAATDTYDGGTAVLGVSCPSSSDCVAVDYNAFALAFNPESVGSADPQTTGAAEAGAADEPGQPLSITCESAADCVVVSDSGDAYQGDPETGTWIPEEVQDAGLAAVACPSGGLCVTSDLDSRIFIGTVIPSGLGSGVGSVTAVKALTEGVRVNLACVGSGVDRCAYTLQISGGQGSGLSAAKTLSARPGDNTVTLALSQAAKRVLARHHSLAARVTVTQRRVGFTATLVKRTVSLSSR